MPYLMEEYWNNWTIKHGYPSSFQFAPNYRTPFQNSFILSPPDTPSLMPSLAPKSAALDARLNNAIRLLHERHHNANTEGRYIVYANGATPLWSAIYYALSQVADPSLLPLNLFERTPYYWGHLDLLVPQIIDKDLIRWNPSHDLDPSRTVELLTLPSNPLGVHSTPFYPNSFARVYDLSSNWPSLTSTPIRYDEDIMIFNLAEATGHAATSFGWALIKDPQIALHVADFVIRTALGVSPMARYRAISIFETLNSPNTDYFQTIRTILSERWDRLIPLCSQTHRFVILSTPRTAYLVLRCGEPDDAMNCSAVFQSAGVNVISGVNFGLGNDVVRINLTLWSYAFEVLFKKLSDLVNRL